jgi:hypothetical protein
MRDLGVTQIFAQSPEAKGRIERANGTFQDRLVTELRLADARSIAEANIVLEDFVPRFNQRFGVPASPQEIAYRPLDAEVDLDAILCFKEYRRVGKDNTVQYRRQTLQLFPDTERKSYARTRVEVQERLDGQLVVRYRGKTLNPKEAPPLAAALREMATMPLHKCYESEEPEREESPPPQVQARSIWYEDSELRRLHGELTRSGMKRARERGKQLGRPKVTDRPGFEQHLDSVASRITSGAISRTQGARELTISSGTLKLLLDANLQKEKESLAQLFSGYPDEMKTLAEVAN